MKTVFDDYWETLPSCPGEYQERFKSDLIKITVSAQNWSNKEQKRLRIDDSIKWGVWVGNGSALGLTYDTIEDARRAGLLAAKNALEERIAAINEGLVAITTAQLS